MTQQPRAPTTARSCACGCHKFPHWHGEHLGHHGTAFNPKYACNDPEPDRYGCDDPVQPLSRRALMVLAGVDALALAVLVSLVPR